MTVVVTAVVIVRSTSIHARDVYIYLIFAIKTGVNLISLCSPPILSKLPHTKPLLTLFPMGW